MSFDVSKLSPAPWYFVTPKCDELETLVFLENDDDVPVLSPASNDNWDFVAASRNAFDIQMQMEWGVTCHQDDGWYVIDGSGDRVYIIVGRKNSYPIHEWSPAHHNNPVEAILKTWEWYQANKHREVT